MLFERWCVNYEQSNRRSATAGARPRPVMVHQSALPRRSLALQPQSSQRMTSPTRIAIVGAGPAGFFTVAALLKAVPDAKIDVFNRLPAPYGLVRDGVAPDHEPIKSVSRVFAKLLAADGVRYFGNVEVGAGLPVDVLRDLYDQVVYAVGSQTDRRMNVKGEALEGSHAATAFVGWYNGHPRYRDADFGLDCRRVVVVGNGNVALDAARILALAPGRLATTDIACHALAVLRRSRVREVVVLGRRGPAQASFSTPELKEFGGLDGVSAVADERELALDPGSDALARSDRARGRNMEVLRGYANAAPRDGDRVVRFRFLVSPVAIEGRNGRVSAVRVQRNVLAVGEDGELRAHGIGEMETIPCGMVLRSVGYRGEPVPGVPFDERRGVIPNEGGRVVGADGRTAPGEYVSGWAKRGPSGVIGTNKADAAETVAAMTVDRKAGISLRGARRIAIAAQDRASAVADALRERGVRWIDKDGWARLDACETAAGHAQGRPRVKLCTVAQMLEAAGPPT